MGPASDVVGDILSGATARRAVAPADARSGSTFEHVELGSSSLFVKRSSPRQDWVMRLSGDDGHRVHRLWQSGLMHQLPECIDHAVLAVQVDGGAAGPELTVLMRDVTSSLVPAGEALVPREQHERFLDHLAALSVRFLRWRDRLGLMTMEQRLLLFAPERVLPEVDGADEPPVPLAAAARGWPQLRARAPELAALLDLLHEEPSRLTSLLDRGPATFLHGDWKLGNLGSHEDGRTVLVDWSLPGSGAVCWDLCWYLALNHSRLPESKDEAAERFRRSLERQGMTTEGWFREQLDLSLLAMTATFGWEKALGDDDELAWWERRAMTAAARHHLRVGAAPRTASTSTGPAQPERDLRAQAHDEEEA